ncbi:MAG: hypothetical protein ICV73_03285, partial [Acetobacteraceae bacterium]|nr:hypothetical protein [Acetobacteraceae bacterium]
MGRADDGGAGERRGKMAAIARSLETEFKGQGFALLVFGAAPHGGRVSYLSNRGRGEMLEALRRFAASHGAAAPAA